jgi:superfamily II DNA/RNA helicase
VYASPSKLILILSLDFEDMNLKSDLLLGICEYGWASTMISRFVPIRYFYRMEQPTTLQRETLPTLLQGRDIIIQANTQSGSTTALVVAILQQIDTTLETTQAIIIAHTRESAMGIGMLVRRLGAHLNVECLVCVGPGPVSSDNESVNAPHVVVGTAGRLLETLNSGPLRPDNISFICLDQINESLSYGYEEYLSLILQLCVGNTQVVSTSSNPTQIQAVLELSTKLMQDPVHYRMPRFREFTVEGHKQFFINVEKEDWKLDTLFDLYETMEITRAVIFCNTRGKVEWLGKKMRERGFSVSAMACVRFRVLQVVILC